MTDIEIQFSLPDDWWSCSREVEKDVWVPWKSRPTNRLNLGKIKKHTYSIQAKFSSMWARESSVIVLVVDTTILWFPLGHLSLRYWLSVIVIRNLVDYWAHYRLRLVKNKNVRKKESVKRKKVSRKCQEKTSSLSLSCSRNSKPSSTSPFSRLLKDFCMLLLSSLMWTLPPCWLAWSKIFYMGRYFGLFDSWKMSIE